MLLSLFFLSRKVLLIFVFLFATDSKYVETYWHLEVLIELLFFKWQWHFSAFFREWCHVMSLQNCKNAKPVTPSIKNCQTTCTVLHTKIKQNWLRNSEKLFIFGTKNDDLFHFSVDLFKFSGASDSNKALKTNL